MSVNVGVNGFGRIGRSFFRVWLGNVLSGVDTGFTIVAVNDLTPVSTLAHLLKFDSVYGRLGCDVSVDVERNVLTVAGREIKFFSEGDPAGIRWGELGVSVVAECTGRFTNVESAGLHDAGFVVVSAPCEGADFTCVLGVNDSLLDLGKHRVISNASCTTNCIAPAVKVLDDAFGVASGRMLTVHAYTGDQVLVDGPHKDLRRGRAAGVNIVPTSTGAARAVGLVLPSLAGRLDGYSVRVPVATGSMVDLSVRLRTGVAVNMVNGLFAESAAGGMFGIVEYCDDPIVSSDVVGSPFSCVFDAGLTRVTNGELTVGLWYDNEWGYSNRLYDLVARVAVGSGV